MRVPAPGRRQLFFGGGVRCSRMPTTQDFGPPHGEAFATQMRCQRICELGLDGTLRAEQGDLHGCRRRPRPASRPRSAQWNNGIQAECQPQALVREQSHADQVDTSRPPSFAMYLSPSRKCHHQADRGRKASHHGTSLSVYVSRNRPRRARAGRRPRRSAPGRAGTAAPPARARHRPARAQPLEPAQTHHHTKTAAGWHRRTACCAEQRKVQQE